MKIKFELNFKGETDFDDNETDLDTLRYLLLEDLKEFESSGYGWKGLDIVVMLEESNE